MTGLGTTIGTFLAAAAMATAGLMGGAADGASDSGRSAALVVDGAVARDGRELVDPRLRAVHAAVRLPRTSAEARTNVRYFAELGYRVVVAGPRSRAAARATGIAATRAPDLSRALAAVARPSR